MSRLRILVVENEEIWRRDLAEVMAALDQVGPKGKDSVVDTAANLEQARERIADDAYDLALVDLALPGGEEGFDLLARMRQGTRNRHCAILVVTGTADSGEKYKKAYKEFGVGELVVKGELHLRGDGDDRLRARARAAILEARLNRAQASEQARHHLTFTFDLDGWLEGELRGPSGTARRTASGTAGFHGESWAHRADEIDHLLWSDSGRWREEANTLGGKIFNCFTTTAAVHDAWTAARTLAVHRGDLWLRFRGPREGLGVPFELMKDSEDFFCLRHLLTREIVRDALTPAKDTFWHFLQRLKKEGRSFRGLLVAANADGKIPAVVDEVRHVEERIDADLRRLGLRPELKVLEEAQYEEVKAELASRRYHLFHYAGHGRHDDDLPEASGLVLPEGAEIRSLTASDLGFLAADSELQLVFLSCCLGAVSKTDRGRGDFYGVLDALDQAHVPTLLGYRWTVDDEAARRFAATFYTQIWRTLSPAEAALEARREAAMGKWGRDDETWASPVVVTRG